VYELANRLDLNRPITYSDQANRAGIPSTGFLPTTVHPATPAELSTKGPAAHGRHRLSGAGPESTRPDEPNASPARSPRRTGKIHSFRDGAKLTVPTSSGPTGNDPESILVGPELSVRVGPRTTAENRMYRHSEIGRLDGCGIMIGCR
jgi:hypothetical protein